MTLLSLLFQVSPDYSYLFNPVNEQYKLTASIDTFIYSDMLDCGFAAFVATKLLL